jgi:hypothetical protein
MSEYPHEAIEARMVAAFGELLSTVQRLPDDQRRYGVAVLAAALAAASQELVGAFVPDPSAN